MIAAQEAGVNRLSARAQAIIAANSQHSTIGLRVCAACGYVGYRGEFVGELRHVGGTFDRLEWYCAEEHGHQAKQ